MFGYIFVIFPLKIQYWKNLNVLGNNSKEKQNLYNVGYILIIFPMENQHWKFLDLFW